MNQLDAHQRAPFAATDRDGFIAQALTSNASDRAVPRRPWIFAIGGTAPTAAADAGTQITHAIALRDVEVVHACAATAPVAPGQWHVRPLQEIV